MIILSDDVGTGDVPGYWNDGAVHMPNLQQLVDDGITFTDAHSTPLCAPSRYVLLSGNYQHRGRLDGGTWGINYKGNQFLVGQKSIAQIFRENGYDTSMFGKWHLGGKIPLKDGYKTEELHVNATCIINDKHHDWTKPLLQGPSYIGFNQSYITIGGIQDPPYVFFRDSRIQKKRFK